jgi:hypothetical protein
MAAIAITAPRRRTLLDRLAVERAMTEVARATSPATSNEVDPTAADQQQQESRAERRDPDREQVRDLRPDAEARRDAA